jgi:hypothetical protein
VSVAAEQSVGQQQQAGERLVRTFANFARPIRWRSTPSPNAADLEMPLCAFVAAASSSCFALADVLPSRHAATSATDSGEHDRIVSVRPWNAPAVEQASYVGAEAPSCIRAYASWYAAATFTCAAFAWCAARAGCLASCGGCGGGGA